MQNSDDRYSRLISNRVRFGYGYRMVSGKKQYFAFHGIPIRNSDIFTTTEISKEEFEQIGREYPNNINADKETALIFRKKYVENPDKSCYYLYAGSEGKAFVRNVMPDKATG